MREKHLSERDCIELAERNESRVFDHKAFEVSGKSAMKISVAFANADGGDFVIGICDARSLPMYTIGGRVVLSRTLTDTCKRLVR